jgi:hypothetical protein
MATWARTAKLLSRASQLTPEGFTQACRQSDALRAQTLCPSTMQQMRNMASGAVARGGLSDSNHSCRWGNIDQLHDVRWCSIC